MRKKVYKGEYLPPVGIDAAMRGLIEAGARDKASGVTLTAFYKDGAAIDARGIVTKDGSTTAFELQADAKDGWWRAFDWEGDGDE